MIRDRSLLHRYQHGAVQFIKDNRQCGLFMDMGLGKTVTTLTALSDLVDDFESANILIVAPKTVAFNTWPEEIEAWDHINLSYTLVRGPEQKRWQLLAERTQIKIINVDLIPWLIDYYVDEKPRRCRWPFDTIIIDESSGFKDNDSIRFKSLRKVCRLWNVCVLLTGTPAANGLIGLWSQIYLIDRGERLGRGIGEFRNRFFSRDFNGYSYSVRPDAETEIYKRLSDVCVTLSKEDYLDMPARVDNIITMDLPAKAMDFYKELEKEFIAFLNEAKDQAVDAVSSAVLINKLLQVASGSVYYTDSEDETERLVQYVHGAKLDALKRIIAEANGSPVFIAYNYQHERELILKRIPGAVALDKEASQLAAWNRGEIPILLAHPKRAGHGLNMQKGGHIAVWYSLTWSLELYQQFNARLDRQGQIKSVVIHHIIARGTADETVHEALGGKKLTQDDLLNALKRNIEERE